MAHAKLLHPLTSVLLAAVPGGGPALGRDRDLPPGDPPGHFRRVGRTDAQSSEVCTGPRTPLCAIDLKIACFMRGDVSLCHQIMEDRGERWWHGLTSGNEDVTLYRVINRRRLRPQDLPAWLTDYDEHYRWWAGDVQVTIFNRQCVGARPEYNQPKRCWDLGLPPPTYTLRFDASRGWQVIDWYSPRDGKKLY